MPGTFALHRAQPNGRTKSRLSNSLKRGNPMMCHAARPIHDETFEPNPPHLPVRQENRIDFSGEVSGPA